MIDMDDMTEEEREEYLKKMHCMGMAPAAQSGVPGQYHYDPAEEEEEEQVPPVCESAACSPGAKEPTHVAKFKDPEEKVYYCKQHAQKHLSDENLKAMEEL